MKKIIILFLCSMMSSEIYSVENVINTPKKVKLEPFYSIFVSKQGKKILHCDISGCGRNLNSLAAISQHFIDFHRNSVYMPRVRGKRSESSKNKRALRDSKREICEHCGAKITHGSMVDHKRRIHNIFPEWFCRIEGCTEKFRKILERSRHEKDIHSQNISALLKPNANKALIASLAGLYEKWDATELTLITESQHKLFLSSIRRNNGTFFKKCSTSEYEKNLAKYFAQSCKEGSTLFRREKVKKLLDIYRKISKPSGDFKQLLDKKKIMVVEDDVRIKIRREDKDIIEDIVETLSSQYEDGLSHYDTKESFRNAFKKAIGKYYQKKFDEKMAELGLDGNRELSLDENAIVDEQLSLFKEEKKDLQNLFNQIPLHDRDRGYALKDATYKIVD